jgi:manganese/zinc/iron transport system substrate-binding protein
MMKMMSAMKLIALMGVMLLVMGCASTTQPPPSEGERIKAVATTGMVGDLVREIGGNQIDVQVLMGPGVDPHLYKASEGDVSKLQDAHIIFYNGLHLEAKMAEIFEQMEGRKKAVAVASAIPEEDLLSPEQFAGQHDPHVWFDVTLWMIAAEKVKEDLIAYDPENKALYQERSPISKR